MEGFAWPIFETAEIITEMWNRISKKILEGSGPMLKYYLVVCTQPLTKILVNFLSLSQVKCWNFHFWYYVIAK